MKEIESPKNIKVLKTQTIYQGRAFSVQQELLHLPNGQDARMDIIEHRPSVTILPVDEHGLVWFIRQYRHAVGSVMLELPAGVAEPGEPLETSALRELREEIGMRAEILTLLGAFYLAPGYSSEYMQVFLARDLFPDPLPADVDEILEIEKIPAREAIQLAEQGKLLDSKSIITLFWAKKYLQEMGY